MNLEQFRVSNFRSIDSAELNLHDINILIGKNNAGKSNVANSLYRYRDLMLGGNPTDIFEDVIMRGRESDPIEFEVKFVIDDSTQESIIDTLASEHGLSSELVTEFREESYLTDYTHEISIRDSGITRNTIKTNLRGNYVELGTGVIDDSRLKYEILSPSHILEGERDTLTTGGTRANRVLPDPFKEHIYGEFDSWKLIAPFRRPDAEGGFGAETELDPSGENLTTVLQALRGDGTGRYERICQKYKEVMEGVNDVRIETVQNSNNVAVPKIRIDEQNSSGIDLDEISSGSKEILLLITKIIRSESDASILFLEEPELHLHPAAEKEIYDLILETIGRGGPQVIITTHSDVFVDRVDIEKIISVERDDHTRVETVSQSDLSEKLTDLGFQKSEFIQSDRVVLVEGRSDLAILKNWANVIGEPLSEHGVEIMVFGGDEVLEDGNPHASVIPDVLGQLGIPYRYIFDSDGEPVREKEEEITGRIGESPSKIHVLEQYNIESYLADAPRAVANVLGEDETTIREELPVVSRDTNMKGHLDDLFQEYLDTGYNEEAQGAAIAKNMTEDEIPEEIHSLIEEINQLEGR